MEEWVLYISRERSLPSSLESLDVELFDLNDLDLGEVDFSGVRSVVVNSETLPPEDSLPSSNFVGSERDLISEIRSRYRGPILVVVRDSSPPGLRSTILSDPDLHLVPASDSLDDWIDEFNVSDDSVNSFQTTDFDPRFFEEFIEGAGVAMAVYGSDGVISYANSAYASIFDAGLDEVVGKHLWEIRSEMDGSELDDFWSSFDESESREYETEYRDSEGDEFPVEVVVTRVEVGGVGYNISVVRDISERTRYEEDLREKKEKIESLHTVATEMESADTENEVYELTVDAAENILDFDMITLGVVRDGRIVLGAASSDIPEDGYKEPPVDDGGLAGKSYLEDESYCIDYISEVEEADPVKDYRSAITVPITDVGIIQVVSRETATFDSEDLELVELLVSHTKEAVSRIRSQKALKESERRLSTLIGNLSGMVYRSLPDENRSMEFVSDGSVEVTGYEPDRFVDGELSYPSIIHEDDRDRVISDIDEALEERRDFEVEYRIEAKDGERWVLEKGRGIYAEEDSMDDMGRDETELPDDFVAIEGFITDITERKERQRTLESLQVATRELMQAETREEIVDVAVETAGEVLGLSITAAYLVRDGVLHPVTETDDAREVMGELRSYEVGEGLTGTVFEEGETRVYDKVGNARLKHPDTPLKSVMLIPLGEHGILITSSIQEKDFDDADIEFAKILGANTEAALDRAERESLLRERERELRRQNERLDEFASLVSHDLRNPLEVAQGYFELARETGEDEHFEKVESSHKRIEEIIEDVLTLARHGGTVDETQRIEINEVVEEAWENVDTPEEELVSSTDIVIEADKNRILRLFENLFRNAVEHGGKVIKVGELRGGEGVVGFYVEDNGEGIPLEERDEVLEHGYTTSDDGTGLGLSIVKTAVEAHGWDISVDESEDGGARFEIHVGEDDIKKPEEKVSD